MIKNRQIFRIGTIFELRLENLCVDRKKEAEKKYEKKYPKKYLKST